MNPNDPHTTRPPLNWERGAAVLVCIASLLFGIWLAFRYAWGILLPFLVAYLLSRLIRPPVAFLASRWKLPRGLCAAVLVVTSVGGVSALVVSGLRRGWRELMELTERLTADSGGLVATLDAALSKAGSLSSHIPWLRRLENPTLYAAICERVDALAQAGVEHLGERVSAMIPSAAMAVAEWVPAAFIFVTVTLLACYYLTADDGRLGESLSRGVTRQLPLSLSDRLPPLGRRLGRLFKSYGRAYLLLGLLTFLESFIGLALLGVPYAFILALIIAVVDFLPLLGTGVILIPWAVVCLLLGNAKLAVGLAVLYAVTSIVRQVLEPKLIGDGLGIHPLVSLLAMYAGLRLFGVWGMILAPLVAAGVKTAVEE